VALLIWFGLSFGLIAVHFTNIVLSLIGFIFLLMFSYIVVEKIAKIPSSGKQNVKTTISQVLFRSIMSGSIIAYQLFWQKLAGHFSEEFCFISGMTLAVLIVTHKAHGRTFSVAVMKSLMISVHSMW